MDAGGSVAKLYPTLWSHGLQQATAPCPSQIPWVMDMDDFMKHFFFSFTNQDLQLWRVCITYPKP